MRVSGGAIRPIDAFVLDASVAAKWFLPGEENARQASLVLADFDGGFIDLHAPDHISCEIPSAITAATLGSSARLTSEVAEESIVAFLGMPIQTVSSRELVLDAHQLVRSHRCAFYDAL